MKRFRQRKAFTIVEMVIVIAVIAILATVLVPTFGGIIQKANHSADTQFVASLNVQLTMWQVDNGEIASESDLRDAINDFYGEKDENGKLTYDFYADLSPKSAPQGYHYWWDAADKTVRLLNYEEMGQFPGVVAEDSPNFEASNPRTIANGRFFLMDQKGSDLAKYIAEINNIDEVGEHAALIGTLRNLEDDADFASLIADKLEVTAVANNFGLFFDNGTAMHVYIPAGTTQIGEANVSGSLSGVTEIHIPDGVKLGSNSLKGFFLATDDPENPNTYRDGSTVIYANLTVGQLSEYVSTDAFDCVLEIPTGERYIFDKNQLMQLGTNTTVGTNYSTELKSFEVTFTNMASADFHFEGTFKAGTTDAVNSIFHYSAALKDEDDQGNPTKITLAVGGFNDGSACPARPVTVTGIDYTINSDGNIEILAEDLKKVSSITVSSTDSIKCTIDVVEAKVKSIDILKFEGNDISTNEGSGAGYIPVLTLKYTSEKKSWSLPVTVNFSTEYECDVVDSIKSTVTVTDTNLTYDTENMGLKFTTGGESLVGDPEAYYITVNYGTASRQCKINLIDNKNPVFTVNNSKYNLNNYKDLTFVFGTTAPTGGVTEITWGNLFTASNLHDGEIVTLGDSTLGSNETAQWASQKIDLTSFTESGNATFKISCRGHSEEVTVYIAAGAMNVQNYGEWKQVPNNTSIVLLGNVDVESTNITLSNGSPMSQNTTSPYTGEGKYSKYMSGKDIYGNLYTIDFSAGFKIAPYVKNKYSSVSDSNKSNNYFLGMNGGSINNLIINGPVYDDVSATRGDSAAKNGMYVCGVIINGTDISNSYLSGFRCPIRIESGENTLENTVLNGGAYANIEVYNAKTIYLNNVTTIQVEDSKPGAGIFLGNKAVGNNGVNITVGTRKNDDGTTEYMLYQYNYLKKSTVQNIVNDIAALSIGSFKPSNSDFEKLSNLSHNKNTTIYYSVGVLLWGEGTSDKAILHSDSNLDEFCASSTSEIVYDTLLGYRSVSGFGVSGDTTCNHAFTPAWGTSAEDYQDSREK